MDWNSVPYLEDQAPRMIHMEYMCRLPNVHKAHTTRNDLAQRVAYHHQRNKRKRRLQTGTKKRPDCKHLARKEEKLVFALLLAIWRISFFVGRLELVTLLASVI